MHDVKFPISEQNDSDALPFRYQNGGFSGAPTKSREPVVRPTPLRRPSKARFVAAGLLMLVTAGAGYTAWDSFFRYQAYGVVTGNVVEVASTIDGPVRFLHADEGDDVVHGQRLVTLVDLKTEQQLERIYDDLRMAEATLQAEIARLRWEIDVQSLESDRALAEYSKTLAELEGESAELLKRRNSLRRTQTLANDNVSTDDQLEEAKISEDGQRKQVQALKKSVQDLKDRADKASRLVKPGN